MSEFEIPFGFDFASSRTASLRSARPSCAFSFTPDGTTTVARAFAPRPDGRTVFVSKPPEASVPKAEISSASILALEVQSSCRPRP